jgi:SAM-dependent methyltransferase
VGLDIDPRAVQRARDLHHDARLTFTQNTVDSIPLDDGSADVVISYDVFEHVFHPAIILKELLRILTPAGTVLIGTWGWFHPFAPHLWSFMRVPLAHVLFAERTLIRVCRRVYHSPWYAPNMHDYGPDGQRPLDKYTHEVISTDHLNKYLIQDFERAFLASGFLYETHPVPFGLRYARWTRAFLYVPWLREFIAGLCMV